MKLPIIKQQTNEKKRKQHNTQKYLKYVPKKSLSKTKV